MFGGAGGNYGWGNGSFFEANRDFGEREESIGDSGVVRAEIFRGEGNEEEGDGGGCCVAPS